MATGSSSSAAIPVRKNTSEAGLSSLTATLIKRYGTPQITPIAANNSEPRRDMSPPRYLWSGAIVARGPFVHQRNTASSRSVDQRLRTVADRLLDERGRTRDAYPRDDVLRG